MKYEWFSLAPEYTTYLDCWYHTYDHLSYTCHECGMPVDMDQYKVSHMCRFCGKYLFENKRRYEGWPRIYEQLTREHKE